MKKMFYIAAKIKGVTMYWSGDFFGSEKIEFSENEVSAAQYWAIRNLKMNNHYGTSTFIINA